MGDNKRWFKVWTKALHDPDFCLLPNDVKGLWVTLGCVVAAHGTNGSIVVKKKYLLPLLMITEECFIDKAKMLKSINVSIKVIDDNESISVIFDKWHVYQKDSTGYERLKRYREGKSINANDNGVKTRRRRRINTPKEIDKAFYAFWKNYPKKKGKEQAMKAWHKLSPDDELVEVMLVALLEQKKQSEWLKENGQYIPYPSTWLNQRRWEDELTIDLPSNSGGPKLIDNFSERREELKKIREGLSI